MEVKNTEEKKGFSWGELWTNMRYNNKYYITNKTLSVLLSFSLAAWTIMKKPLLKEYRSTYCAQPAMKG